ncbi:B115 [Murid betaherpesvirus 8]|uniref:Envelope glycoprotein L n=1 Tax=Rat cytomegalovirus (isolate England) TaxID=1261657 RepID=A0A0E3X4A8_RCMVE|nr:B115 [Murid betaherpesvirus 8]WPH25017.1 B115 [Murid betaherpesvirus 8]WPH25151.1 B115 [Murid betaherpesvirus 8]
MRCWTILFIFGFVVTTNQVKQAKQAPSKSATDTVHVLHGTTPANETSVNSTCRDVLIKCYNATAYTPIFGDGPLRPVIQFSTLIKYKRAYGGFPSPIKVDDEFLKQLALLYNNENQLRVLLTLLKSKREKDWLSFLNGYNECDYHYKSSIFTCVNDTCTEHNLLKLNYTNDVFAENVIGFDISPPSLYVLVLLRNNKTNTEEVIRVPTISMSLFDATYNLVRSITEITGFGQDLSDTVRDYRKLFPTLFTNSDLGKIIPRHRHRNF